MDKDFWDEHRKYIRHDFFSADVGKIIDAIDYLHESGVQPDTTNVADHLVTANLLSNTQIKFYSSLLLQLKEVDTSNALGADYVNLLYARKTAQAIADKAIRVVEGTAELSELKEMLNFEYSSSVSYEVVDTSVDNIESTFNYDDLYEFGFEPLARKVPGAGRENHVVIFAKSETGKSTFATQMCIGHLKQGKKVLYFGNEDPARKIVANHIKCALNMTGEEIIYAKHNDPAKLQPWEDLRKNFVLIGKVGLTIEEVRDIINREEPDVVIVDQVDPEKIKISFDGPRHEKYKYMYTFMREIAKNHGILVYSISQASHDATGRLVLYDDMMEGSKVGKSTEVDMVIGIGRRQKDDSTRCLTISKNKINGWHGQIYCKIDAPRCRYVE